MEHLYEKVLLIILMSVQCLGESSITVIQNCVRSAAWIGCLSSTAHLSASHTISRPLGKHYTESLATVNYTEVYQLVKCIKLPVVYIVALRLVKVTMLVGGTVNIKLLSLVI